MAKLLFRLRHVPDDEAREVRDLLDANDIDYYETSAGNWGLSMPALWLRHDHQMETARALLDDYQHERRERVRAEYHADRQAGRAYSQLDMLLYHPIRTLGCTAAAAAILYFSISAFFSF